MAFVTFGAFRLYFRLTDDFRLSNITYEMGYHPEWEVKSLTPLEKQQWNDILSQTFTYIGKGAQAYAFESEDGRYVLKFFKFKHLKPSFLVTLFPVWTDFQKKEIARKQKKLESVFNGYKLGFDLDQKNAGLIYVQLNPTYEKKEVRLIDKMGIERTVDVGDIVYVIQEKGETSRTVFNKLFKEGNIDEAKVKLRQLMDLYHDEYQKGLYDRDHGVMHNTGFVESRPFHLDIGKLSYDEKMKDSKNFKEDLMIVAFKIRRWILQVYPEHYKVMAEDLDKKLSELFKEEFHFPEAFTYS